jgi:hypothetical protein
MRSIGLVVVVLVALSAGCLGDESLGTTEQSLVSPPANFTATVVSPFQVDLAWDAVVDAEYYVIQSGYPPNIPIQDRTSLSPSTTAWSDVTPGTDRDIIYRVKVAVGGEVSGPSNQVLVHTPPFLPPADVSATAPQATGIHLQWTAAAYASKYYLYRATGAGSFAYLTTVIGTSYDDLGLAPSTQYRYYLVSGDDISVNHLSANSAIVTATTPATTPVITPPASITATAVSSSSIRVEWSAVSGATKYYVFQAQGAGPFAYVGTALTTSWDAIGLAASTSYSFRVQAVDVFDNASVNSATATATTLAIGTGAAAAPTVMATAYSSSHILVSWNAVPNAVKYYVFQAQGAGPHAYVGTFSSTTYTASQLAASTTYSFIVQAVDVFDIASPDSAPATATTFGGGSISAVPTGVTATAISSSRIAVSWNTASLAAKYYVFQAQGAGPFVYVGTRFSTSFEATNLAANTEYSFVIQSVDSFDVASANSAPASATTLADGTSVVSAPTNVVATAISSSRIDVTWNAVGGAVKYYVFQAQGAGPMVYAGTMTSASYLATGLSASTEYSYVIKAVDANDVASADSSVASATTLSNAATVTPPTDVAAVALSSSRIDVTWTAVSGAVKYYVFQAEGAGSAAYVGTVTSPGFHASGLTLDTTQVASVGANDVASALSTPPASATTSSENNGVCSILPAAQQYNASVPRMAVIADFNGDGRNDIALAQQSANSVGIVLSIGTTFGTMVSYGTGSNPLSIATADFNGDGKIDLVTGDACNSAPCTTSVLLGNGDGTFATKTSHSVPALNVPRIAAGDVTGDGNADVIAAAGTGVVLLAGNGSGGFAAPSTLVLRPGGTVSPNHVSDVQIADVDGDGGLDVVAIDSGVAGAGTASVLGVFLQTPTGLAAPVTKNLGLWSRSVALGDVSGDGNVDALVADGWSGAVAVTLGNGDGSFGSVTSYVVGTPASPGPPDLSLVRIADVDDDGHVDFIAMLERGSVDSGQLVVRRGHSDGTFTTPTLFTGATAIGPGAAQFAVGSLSADSIPDFVILSQPSNVMSIRYGRCQ